MTAADGTGVASESIPEHERASATPNAHGHGVMRPATLEQPVTRPRKSAQSAPRDTSLRGRQEWFARAVMTAETEPPAVSADEAAAVLTKGPALGAFERLDIYRRAYHARLIECLADDYAVLKETLGDDAFEELCRAYISKHPSGSPNLNAFGRSMADFIVHGAPTPPAPCSRVFASELAELEWAIVEVIHASSSPPLTLEGLGDVPIERWVEARLVPTPAFRLLRFAYPTNAFFQASRQAPQDSRPPLPAPSASAVVVYRSGPTLWRMGLSEPMVALLSALSSGETLGAAVDRAATAMPGVEEDETAGRVLVWFRDWVGSGLFSGVHF